jgi:hypothetical protein
MREREGWIAGQERVQPSVARQTKKATVAPQADLLEKICTGKPDAVVHARAWNRMTNGQPSRAVSFLPHLQKSYGNRYVQRVLAADQTPADQTSDDSAQVSLPPITFEREPSYFSLEGGCDGLHLHGTADAAFSSKGSVQNQVSRARQGCDCEKGVRCLHVTGTLVTNYAVSVTITMPPVPSGLTDCERAHVRAFLQNVLRPHEEDHRTRFGTYNGQTRNPVDVTGCGKDDIAQQVQAIGDAEDAARQTAANALSGAIDPFVRSIDCSDCEKGSAAPHAGQGTGPDAGASADVETPDAVG